MFKELQFYLGEKRMVGLIISSMDNLPFIIKDASYKLKFINEVLIEGPCLIDSELNKISAIIEPTKKGSLYLDFSYSVLDEVFVERIILRVK